MNLLKILLAMLILGLTLAAACSTADQPATNASASRNAASASPAPAATADETAIAAEIFTANCALCHRETGKGGKLTLDRKTIDPEDLTAAKIKNMTDEKLTGYITSGIPDEGMPAFKDKLTPEQIKRVIGHVRRLQAN